MDDYQEIDPKRQAHEPERWRAPVDTRHLSSALVAFLRMLTELQRKLLWAIAQDGDHRHTKFFQRPYDEVSKELLADGWIRRSGRDDQPLRDPMDMLTFELTTKGWMFFIAASYLKEGAPGSWFIESHGPEPTAAFTELVAEGRLEKRGAPNTFHLTKAGQEWIAQHRAELRL